jgi:DNA-binding LacI/PurR family transcriptional regulator
MGALMSRNVAKVGSADVAKLAGVSRSAVSRTFTEGAYVSDETRAKVLKAAEMLGYRPNVLARSLTTNRTHIIGIITSDLDNAFYATLLYELIERIQGRGMATFVLCADKQNNDEVVSRLLSYQVEGVIVTNTRLSSKMAFDFARGGKPIVTINRYVESDDITAVTCDNEECGAKVADLFVDIGRKRIAFIAGDPDTSSSRDRERGFGRRLSERGRLLAARAIGRYTHQGGLEAARTLFGAAERPDAVFVANDLMAFAVIDVIRREFGLRVPEDVAVVGFDNSPPAAWPTYQLTSVDQHIPRMADLAVDELIGRLSGEDRRVRHYNIVGSLVLRESTGHAVAG